MRESIHSLNKLGSLSI